MNRILCLGLFLILHYHCTLAQVNQKNRVIILTDIEADPDDTQSLVRLFLYSNVIEIKGLVATTSVHQKSMIAPESIKKIINGYEQIQPNLLKHETGFPLAPDLLKLVKKGKPEYGMNAVE